jgi:membrane protein implicated in regulation of membrane protease activity
MPIAVIWAVLSKLPWKYIGIFLAAFSLTLLVWRAPWAEHRQKAKDAVARSSAITAQR